MRLGFETYPVLGGLHHQYVPITGTADPVPPTRKTAQIALLTRDYKLDPADHRSLRYLSSLPLRTDPSASVVRMLSAAMTPISMLVRACTCRHIP